MNVTSASLYTDRNETRTWSPLPPQEPSHKIWYKSVHNLFRYRGHSKTDTRTHKPTPERTYAPLSRGELEEASTPKSVMTHAGDVCAIAAAKWGLHARGTITTEKLRGTKVWSQHRGACPKAQPQAGLMLGAGGVSPSLCGVRSIIPGKFLRTQMLNPALW